MPKLLPFKKSSHQSYSVSGSSFLVHVKLLDGSDVDLSLPVETKGGECLERVATYLNLKEVGGSGAAHAIVLDTRTHARHQGIILGAFNLVGS